MNTRERKEIVAWAEAVLNDELGEAEFGRLQARLTRDEEARRLYLEHVSLEPMLRYRFEAGGQASMAAADETASSGNGLVANAGGPASDGEAENVVAFPGRGKRVGWAAAAAVALAALILISGWRPGGDAGADGSLAGGGGSNSRSPVIPVSTGEHRTVRFASGAVAQVSGDADFSVAGDNAGRLLRGAATFFVPEAAQGFTLELPWGSVLDLGTRFEVRVGTGLVADTWVREGKVRAEASVSGESRDLVAGESVRIGSRGLEPIPAEGEPDALVDAAERDAAKRAGPYQRGLRKERPVAYWGFAGEEGTWLTEGGEVVLTEGPQADVSAGFLAGNTAALFRRTGELRRPDRAGDGRYDFRNGDEITLEAWVNPGPVDDNRNLYIVGKGRTNNVGFEADNQNYSLRLRGQNGEACPSFLFRSAGSPAGDEGFHRWTTVRGVQPGSGWHHIAVTYRFGDPDSVRGYLDGEPVEGAWDMGGATTKAPVVDNDELWVGSARGGDNANSFHGALDEIAIHRRILSPQELSLRVRGASEDAKTQSR